MHPRLQPTWPQQLLSSVLAFLMALPGNIAVAAAAINAGPVERPADDPEPAARRAIPTVGSHHSEQPQSLPAPPPALSATPPGLRIASSPGLTLQLLSAASLGLAADGHAAAGLAPSGTPAPTVPVEPALTPSLSRRTGEGASTRKERGVALASPESDPEDPSANSIHILEVAYEILPGAGAAVTIRFEVHPDRQYVVEFRDEFGVPDFCAPWKQLPNAPHNRGEVTDLQSGPSRFYRVRAIESPQQGLFALLANDTGARGDDQLTSDPAITGEVTLAGAGHTVHVALDQAEAGYVPLLDAVEQPRHFELPGARILELAGDTLEDGAHTLFLALVNDAGERLATYAVPFVLDTTPPALSVRLDPATDSLPLGDSRTEQHWVALLGQTEPGAFVMLEPNGLWTYADTTGAFRFDLLPLELGGNTFLVHAFDQACVEAVAEYRVTRIEFDLSSPFDDALTGWDRRITTPRTGVPGGIAVQQGKVTLTEGDSFEVALERDLEIPAGAGMLYLSYTAPSFDATARNRMNDAFEVALVDVQGRPLTYTIQAAAGILPASVALPPVLPASATVFFNHSQGQTPFAAPGAEVLARNLGGYTLRADIRHLPANSHARLILRLVNNDRDLASAVQLQDLRFVPDLVPLNFPGSPPPAFSAIGRGASGQGSLEAGLHPGCEPARNLRTTLTGPKIVDGLPPRSSGAPASPTLAVAAPADQATLPPQPVLLTGYAVAGTTLGAHPPGSRDPEIIFAEDVSPWPPEINQVPRLDPINSRQAMASFAARLLDVRTEDFESYPVGSSPSTLMFGSTAAGLLGQRVVYEALDPTTTYDGTFPSSGTRYILLYPGDRPAAGSVLFRVEFSSPQSAFGFFGTDFEANRFELVLTGADGVQRTVPVPVTLPQSSGGACFFGVIDTSQPFLSAEFRNIGTVADGFGFDDLRIATPEQVLPKPIANRIVLVTVNGMPVDALDPAGNFFAAVQVLPGRNRFEVAATDAYDLSTTNIIEVLGTTCVENLTSLSEVTASIEPQYGRTSFNEWTHTLYADVAIRNVGSHPIQAPLLVGVTAISEPSVALLGADGVSLEGIPYYDFTPALATDPLITASLPTGSLTASRSLAFHNPNRVQFTHELVVLGQLNRLPVFTTVPRLEATVGQPYTYDAEATDPDGDVLTYLTSVASVGMAVDPVSGMVSWVPGDEHLGLHEVILVADDRRGGTAEQRFMLSVIEPPANRPPFFISTPSTTTSVSRHAAGSYEIGWMTDDIRLSNTSQPSILPTLFVDADELIHVVFTEGPHQGFGWYDDLSYARVKWDGTVLTPATPLNLAGWMAEGTLLAKDSDLVHLVWHGSRLAPGEEVYHTVVSGDGVAHGVTQLTRTPSRINTDLPRLARGQADVLYLVFQDEVNDPIDGDANARRDVFLQRFRLVGSTPELLGSPIELTTAEGVGFPNVGYVNNLGNIAVDDRDQVHVVWADWRNSSDTVQTEVYYERVDADGLTIEDELPVSVVDGIPVGPPWVEVDSSGIVHVLWSELRGETSVLVHAQIDEVGEVRARQDIITGPEGSVSSVSAAIDGFDRLHVLRMDSSGGGSRMIYQRFDRFGNLLTNPLEVTHSTGTASLNQASYRSIDVAPNGRVSVVWTDTRDGNEETYFKSFMINELSEPTYRYVAQAVDPDHDALTYSLLDGPRGMTMDPITGTVLWTPTADSATREATPPPDPSFPLVPGFDVELYGHVTDPVELTFDPLGNLFVGRDRSGSGGRTGDPALVHRVGRVDGSVTEYGRIPTPDPDTVLADPAGLFAGTPGAVLVGGQNSTLQGVISAILPDGSVSVIRGPLPNLSNPTSMRLDQQGRLVLVDHGRGAVLRLSSTSQETLVDTAGLALGMDLDAQGNIYLSTDDGRIRLYNRNGQIVNDRFVEGLGGYTRLAVGTGGVWGEDVYAVDRTSGSLLRVSPAGVRRVIGTGFSHSDADGMAFGPDGALYIGVFSQDRIIRIAPGREALGLASGQAPVAVQVTDGRGGYATQRFVVTVRSDPDNHDPVIVSEPVTSVVPGGVYSYPVRALDPDGDAVAFALDTAPDGMAIDATTGLLQWTPAAGFFENGKQTYVSTQFPGAEWGAPVLFGVNNSPSVSVHEQASGGNLGSYLEVNLFIGASQGRSPVTWVFVPRIGAIHNASVQGAIRVIRHREERQTINSPTGAPFGQLGGLALRQDGRIYAQLIPTGNKSRWTAFDSGSLTETDFVLMDYDEYGFNRGHNPHDQAGINRPDFSSRGSPIEFGVLRWLNNAPVSSGYRVIEGIDNWHLEVQADLAEPVALNVRDGRGGGAVQQFEVGPSRAGTIAGFAFADQNRDGTWNRLEDLWIGPNRYAMPTGVKSGELRNFGSGIFAAGPEGYLYEFDRFGRRILRYDPETLQFVDVFLEDDDLYWSHSMRFGPGGDLFVTDFDNSRILRYSGSLATRLGVFASGGGLYAAWQAVFAPNGNLFVTSIINSRIYEYRGSDGAFVRSLSLPGNYGATGIDVGPDGRLYVGTYHGDNVYRYDPVTGALIDEFVPSGRGGLDVANLLAFSPSGKLYVWSAVNEQTLEFEGGTGQFLRAIDSDAGSVAFVTGGEQEPVLVDWPVYLDANRNGQRDDGEVYTTTDANGQYALTNLAAGIYHVRQELRPGWRASVPVASEHRVEVATGGTVWGIAFGNIEAGGSAGNASPNFVSTPVSTAEVGRAYQYDADASDIDGDPVTFELLVNPTGMAAEPASGVIAWLPGTGQVGSHQVVLRVQDGRGGVGLQTWQIQVNNGNTAPLITSAPGLRAVVGLPYEYVVRAQDAEGHELTFTLAAPLDGMSITRHPQQITTALLEWTPVLAQLGSHPIEIVVTDELGGVTRQAFTLEVVAGAPNQPPYFTSTPGTRARVGIPYVYLLRGQDPDADPITFALSAGPDGMAFVDDPPPGYHQRLLSWTPSGAQVGEHEVQLQVSDGRGGVATQPFRIQVSSTIENRPPLIVSTPSLQATVDQTYAYDLEAEDPEGDPLRWKLEQGPVGMSLDADTGALRWTPGPEHAGTVDVLVRVSDALLATDTQPFTIEIGWVNRAPQISSTPPTRAPKDQPYLYAARATDPDGDRVRWSVVAGPADMTVDETTGLVRWTPAAAQMGSHAIVIQASDGRGGDDTQAYTLIAADFEANSPPLIVSQPPLSVGLGRTYRYAAAATDPDQDLLTLELRAAPPGVSFTLAAPTPARSEGLVEWNPAQAGSYEFILVARDPLGETAAQRFVVQVRENRAPLISSAPGTTASPGLVYRYDVFASDPDGDRLRYGLVEAPPGMAIDDFGRIAWTPTLAQLGAHPVHLQVTDGYGGVADQQYLLTVEADTQPPVVELEVFATLVDDEGRKVVEVNKPVRFRATAADNVGVESLRLQAGADELPLDGGGHATATLASVGFVDVVATATDSSGNAGSATERIRVVDLTASGNPVVTIESPTTDATLMRPTPVVITVTSAAPLVSYKVEYANAGDVDLGDISGNHSAFATLRAVEVPPGTLELRNLEAATFDPTTLLNDSYLIRVTATDINNRSRVEGVLVHVQGNLKFGEFRLEFTDLAVPVAGIPIQVSRVYDSRLARRSGDFGFGWSLGVQDAQIRETLRDGTLFNGSRVYLNTPDGWRVGFTVRPELVGSFGFTFVRARFIADPGVYERLQLPDDPIAILYQGSFLGGLGDEPFDPSQYVLTTKDGTVYEYDQSRGLQRLTDLSSNRLVFGHDGIFHYSAGQTTPDQAIPFHRDARGRITRILDPDGNPIQYTYDSAGDLRTFSDQVTNITQYAYDTARVHFLTNIIDPLGRHALRMEYDATGRLATIRDALDNPIEQNFNLDTSTVTYKDANGHTNIVRYDDQGNEILKAIPGISTNTFAYDANNNLTNSVDGRGFVTTRVYDSGGNLTQIVDALSNVTAIAYNTFNKPTRVTDALGHPTEFRYNERGDLTNVINALGGQAYFTRDTQGRVTSVTDFNGHTTLYDYAGGCACGKPGKVINPDGTFRLFDYNALGQTTREVNELGHETLYGYDDAGRLLWVRDAEGHTTRYTYAASLKTSETDPLGRTTWYAYDDANRQIAITNAMGGVVRFEYDNGTNRTAVIDPVGNVTRFFYDAGNRVTHQVDAWGRTNFFAYDAVGNLTESIDRNGRRRTFGYDSLNRRTDEVWWDGASAIRSIDYTFNARGLMTRAGDPASQLAFSFDALKRQERVTQSGVVGMPDFTLAYDYDGKGNVVSIVDNWGAQVTSAYDARNRLTERHWQGGGLPGASIHFDYDAAGNRTNILRYADVAGTVLVGQSRYGFSVVGLVTNILHASGAEATLAEYRYQRNGAQEIVARALGQQLSAFAYDLTGQLTNAAYSGRQPNESYNCDANGNRIGNGYVVTTSNQIITDGTHTYAYDFEGSLVARTNLATGASAAFTFDHRNRLVTVVDKDAGGTVMQTVDFTYDALNRRIAKSLNGTVTHFLLSQEDIWADANGTGSITARYLVGDRIDEMLARYRPEEEVVWYLVDNLGTVVDVCSASGQILTHITYDTYGRIQAQTNPERGDRFGFTGREADTEIGLLYYRARYYDPLRGRFLSQDPSCFKSQDSNLYRYVFNDPINTTDPTGKVAIPSYAILLAVPLVMIGTPAAALAMCKEEGLQAGAGLPGQYCGQGDFMRHCTWGCCAARKVGGVLSVYVWFLMAGFESTEGYENDSYPENALFDIFVSNLYGVFIASKMDMPCESACDALSDTVSGAFGGIFGGCGDPYQ